MPNYEALTVLQLKKDLASRGASLKGRKKDLIERLEAYERNQNFQGPIQYIPDDHDDQSVVEWPVSGLRQINDSARAAICIEYHELEAYLARCIQGNSNHEEVINKGLKLLEATRVLAASYRVVSDVFFSGVVGAAMKKKIQYAVKMKVSQEGVVINADCECPAGSGPTGSCKHIACFGLMLLTFKKTGKLRVRESCTSSLQTFHCPAGYSGSPTKSDAMKRPYGGNDLRDPRDLKYRNMAGYNDWVRNHALGTCYWTGLDLAIRYLIPKADIQQAALDHDYLEKNMLEYWVDDSLKSLPDSEVDAEYYSQIEKSTRQQSRSKEWHYHRKWRITASIFGTIYHLTERRNMEAFFNQLLHPPKLNTAPVLYGKKTEATAILSFEKKTGLQVTECGLFIHEECPFLAATPDGLTESGNAVVEVKCPYSCRDKEITESELTYMQKSASGLKLKVGSTYYCQLQGQMAVTGIHRAYFVVYSPKSVLVEKVCFSEEFWGVLLHKLKGFYAEYKCFVARHL